MGCRCGTGVMEVASASGSAEVASWQCPIDAIKWVPWTSGAGGFVTLEKLDTTVVTPTGEGIYDAREIPKTHVVVYWLCVVF